MTLELTYFDVEFTGRIDVPFPSTAVGLAEPERFPTVVIASPTPDQIAAIVNSPIFSEGRIAAGSPDDFISGAIPIDFILDNRLTNLAESHVTGLELLLSYAVDSRFGTFSAGINGSYMPERCLVAGEAITFSRRGALLLSPLTMRGHTEYGRISFAS